MSHGLHWEFNWLGFFRCFFFVFFVVVVVFKLAVCFFIPYILRVKNKQPYKLGFTTIVLETLWPESQRLGALALQVCWNF